MSHFGLALHDGVHQISVLCQGALPVRSSRRDGEHLPERQIEELADRPEELVVGRKIDGFVKLEVGLDPKQAVATGSHRVSKARMMRVRSLALANRAAIADAAGSVARRSSNIFRR